MRILPQKILTLLTLPAAIPLVAAVNQSQLSEQSDLSNVQQQQRYIVSFKQSAELIHPDQQRLSHQTLIKQQGGTVVKHLPSINGMAVTMNAQQREMLANNPEVDLIEEDPRRYLQADQKPWGLHTIQAAGDYPDLSGNRSICIVDTGYDITHEDLMQGANVSGSVSNTLSEQVDLGEWSQDSYGHGTHVAGIISAVTNNIGIRGINHGNVLNIHNVKIIHNPNYWSIWGSDMIDALNQCREAGANIINISLAGSEPSQLEQQAFDDAWAAGLMTFGAAGNRGNTSLYYPASYDSVVSVGAIDENNEAWRYTQKNAQIELVAPGVQVKSTFPGNQYREWDGTSVATPFVAGIAAQVWSRNPACRNDNIRDFLQQSSLDLGEPGRDNTFGFGLVQLTDAKSVIPAGLTLLALVWFS